MSTNGNPGHVFHGSGLSIQCTTHSLSPFINTYLFFQGARPWTQQCLIEIHQSHPLQGSLPQECNGFIILLLTAQPWSLGGVKPSLLTEWPATSYLTYQKWILSFPSNFASLLPSFLLFITLFSKVWNSKVIFSDSSWIHPSPRPTR
jgi:hypothetical protein